MQCHFRNLLAPNSLCVSRPIIACVLSLTQLDVFATRKHIKMAALNEGFRAVSSMFKIPDLNVHKKQAIRKIIVDKEDLFVNLPTGFGKSLIYQSLPLVFDHVSEQTGHIVVVVSPLVRLMEDQVQHLRSLGVSAVNISTKTEIDRSKIKKGEYSVVYGSPEAWLMNERWRSMLGNDVYTSKLCMSMKLVCYGTPEQTGHIVV